MLMEIAADPHGQGVLKALRLPLGVEVLGEQGGGQVERDDAQPCGVRRPVRCGVGDCRISAGVRADSRGGQVNTETWTTPRSSTRKVLWKSAACSVRMAWGE